jgi:hypothetical protein
VHDVVHRDTADEQSQSEDECIFEDGRVRVKRSLCVHEENGNLNSRKRGVRKRRPASSGVTSSPLGADKRKGSLHISIPVVCRVAPPRQSKPRRGSSSLPIHSFLFFN